MGAKIHAMTELYHEYQKDFVSDQALLFFLNGDGKRFLATS